MELTEKTIWSLTVKPAENHRETVFHFQHPPSREDFIALTKKLPWTSVWDDTFLPVVAEHDWPMIDFAHKAASVFLPDGGSLQVRKVSIYVNEKYTAPLVSIDARDAVVRHLPADKRDDAHKVLRERENRIQERIVESGDYSDQRVAYEIRLILHEARLLKTKPKAPSVSQA